MTHENTNLSECSRSRCKARKFPNSVPLRRFGGNLLFLYHGCPPVQAFSLLSLPQNLILATRERKTGAGAISSQGICCMPAHRGHMFRRWNYQNPKIIQSQYFTRRVGCRWPRGTYSLEISLFQFGRFLNENMLED